MFVLTPLLDIPTMQGLVVLGSIAAMLLSVTPLMTCDDLVCPGRSHGSLSIGAFNIRIFGTNKVGTPGVVDILVKILQRYDLVLIQEIRDRTETAIYVLLEALNSEADGMYEMVLSSRLGRSSSKEQYAYMYRPSLLTLLHTYEYNDTANDDFEREPFIAYFESPTAAIDRFGIIGVHVKPSDASEEIDQLVKVYDDYLEKFQNENAIIAGDLNADCSYLSNAALRRSLLRIDSRFRWIISDDADTTVGSSDCSYDRFVAAGQGVLDNIHLNKTGVFHFDQFYGLDSETALDVSDHYPIEMCIHGSPAGYVRPTTASSATSRRVLPAVWLYFVVANGLLVYKTTTA